MNCRRATVSASPDESALEPGSQDEIIAPDDTGTSPAADGPDGPALPHPDDSAPGPTRADRPVDRLTRPLREFLHLESAGGMVLVLATITSLIVANTSAGPDVRDFWGTKLTLLAVGDLKLEESLEHWVNDGLMAIFFFVVALEIKRELVVGRLRDRRAAFLPAMAALGGSAVPAALFLAFTVGRGGAGGWGIPMATDIAFALGVMALLGPRIPGGLKVFLLTLAIVDDILAIMVIALFYSESLSAYWLLLGAVLLLIIAGMNRAGVRYVPLYVVAGAGVWLAFLESGVHATIAGVILGLMTPARPLLVKGTSGTPDSAISSDTVRGDLFEVRESVSVAERLEHLLHPWTAFVILPLFAFVNAGIPLSGGVVGDAASSPLTLGIVVGLLVGKPVGIVLATWVVTATGAAPLPAGTSWRGVMGAGALAGIGFTVSLFVAGLAFDDSATVDRAKVGILAASFAAAVLGAVLLSSGAHRPAPAAGPGSPARAPEPR